jgi:hypothetical protein
MSLIRINISFSPFLQDLNLLVLAITYYCAKAAVNDSRISCYPNQTERSGIEEPPYS